MFILSNLSLIVTDIFCSLTFAIVGAQFFLNQQSNEWMREWAFHADAQVGSIGMPSVCDCASNASMTFDS